MEKNPRKRGLNERTWTEQRDLFRDMSQRRRKRYAAAKIRADAIISKTESEKCADPLESEEVVISARSTDKKDENIHAPDLVWETLVTSAAEAATTSAVDVERIACGDIEAGTEVQLSRKCRKSLELLAKQISQVKAFRTAAQQPYVRSVDSKGNIKMLFCDTGNNASSVMALD